jgi:hypothetical protein
MAGAPTVGHSRNISTVAQYVTPDSKIYCEKLKCAGLAQEIGFFTFVQLAMAGERRNIVVHLQKRV